MVRGSGVFGSSSESGSEREYGPVYRPRSGSVSQRIQPGMIEEAGSVVEESMSLQDELG